MSDAIVKGDAYLALPRSVETWLIEPILPTGGVLLLYGDPKVGKSYAALQLAGAIATQTDWLGFPVRTKGPVVYIQLDTPRSLWAERLIQLREAGWQSDSLFFADRETLAYFPFDILDPAHSTYLSLHLKDINPVAVVVDTLRESHRGEENDSTSMQAVVSSLVAATQPAALILVSHSRKSIGDYNPDLMNDNRGSNYVVGRMDTILRFSKKSIHFNGRAIEEGSIKMKREDSGLWVPDQENSQLNNLIEQILLDPTLTSTLSRARALSERTGKGEEACRSLLRRASLR